MRALTLACCACLFALSDCSKNADGPPAPTPECGADSDCKDGMRCVAQRCLDTRCGDHPCHAGQGCDEGECRGEDCVGVTCAAGEGCAMGQCLPIACGTTACAPGDVCVSGKCVFAQCAEKTCAREALCADGHCLGLVCGSTPCAIGAGCSDGKCVAATCVGVTCGVGTTCAVGRCVPTDCGATKCGAGLACVGGACADPTCAGLTCSAGQRCSAGACSACPAHETVCGDGLDDDCDGLVDCADPDCDAMDCADGKTCKALACAPEPCGNGKLDAGEECDDGNRKDGDGCSKKCQLECGFTCDGAPSFCTADDFFDVSDKIAAASKGQVLKAMAVADDGLYVGGDKGVFLKIDRRCQVTDLGPKLSPFWADAPVVTLAFEPAAKVLYLGGAVKGRFALYHPAGWAGADARHAGADTAFDLSGKHALTTQPWSIDQIVADPTGNAVYLAANDTSTGTSGCGPSHLVRYRPDADACDVGINACPNQCQPKPDTCTVNALALDEPARVLWAVGRGKAYTGIHKLDLASGTFTKSLSDNLTNNFPRALVLDASAKALYAAGTVWDSYGGELVRWESAGPTTTKLSDKLAALWGPNAGDLNDLWALAVDPVNHVVYAGGNLAKLARYRTLENTLGPDTASLIALTSTTWGSETVRALAYDPAGFVWIAGSNGKLARRKARP